MSPLPMGLRILVVDDDEVTARMVGRLLHGEGYTVDVRASGTEALACLRGSPHDLLLTDLVMPRMDGLQLIVAAHALDPGLRCIVMSGHARESACASDVAWLDKPVDIDRLLCLLQP